MFGRPYFTKASFQVFLWTLAIGVVIGSYSAAWRKPEPELPSVLIPSLVVAKCSIEKAGYIYDDNTRWVVGGWHFDCTRSAVEAGVVVRGDEIIIGGWTADELRAHAEGGKPFHIQAASANLITGDLGTGGIKFHW